MHTIMLLISQVEIDESTNCLSHYKNYVKSGVGCLEYRTVSQNESCFCANPIEAGNLKIVFCQISQ